MCEVVCRVEGQRVRLRPVLTSSHPSLPLRSEVEMEEIEVKGTVPDFTCKLDHFVSKRYCHIPYSATCEG